jgi:hypothetical protein
MQLDWRRVWSTVVGGTIVKIMWVFVIVVSGYIGLSPEAWVRTLIPANFAEGSLLVARVIFLFLGSAVLVLCIQNLRAIHWPSEFVPMEFAAISAYEKAREKELVLAYMAERASGMGMRPGSEDDIINFLATWVARKIEPFGIRPPVRKSEVFLVGGGSFKNRGSEYWDSLAQAPTYRDVRVKRADLNKLLAALKSGEYDIV